MFAPSAHGPPGGWLPTCRALRGSVAGDASQLWSVRPPMLLSPHSDHRTAMQYM